jgi:hypothetical protein
LLVDGNDTEMEDNEEDEEAEEATEAEPDSELHATDVAINAAAAQHDAEMEACAWQERYERRHVENLAEARVKVEAALAAAEEEREAAVEAKHIAAVEAVEREHRQS